VIDPSQLTPSERRKRLFDALGKWKEGKNPPLLDRCMYWLEDCSDSIKSHSLSRCWLETVEFQGHVVKAKLGLHRPDAGGQKQFAFFPELVGCNDVSVFRGFCNKHDTQLFQNLDTLNVEPTADDCMKLIYRSVARELAAKHYAVAMFLEQGMGANEEAFKSFVWPQMDYALNLLSYKFEIEAALASGAYSDYEHLVFDIEERPPFLATTTFYPIVTARGRVLERNRSHMTLTLLPKRQAGLAVLSWSRIGNPCASKFAHALRKVPLHLVGMAIARMFFEMSDNVVFSPVYWHGLPEECKQAIMTMHARSIINREDYPPTDVFVPNYKTDHPFALDVRTVRSL
jgi:hypothetical protein